MKDFEYIKEIILYNHIYIVSYIINACSICVIIMRS
jgi:hypothetical protein